MAQLLLVCAAWPAVVTADEAPSLSRQGLGTLAAAVPAALPAAEAPSHWAVRIQGHRRPKIGLVLSGGGARGLAHVGVLQTLHDLRVPIDLVVGTSMGALVGGAYASGRSVHALDALVRQADWTSILAERSPRRDFNFARREEDRVLASRVELGLGRDGLLLPPAAAGNSGLDIALDRLAPGRVGLQPLRQLPLPFEALATDLVNGQMVLLSDAPLTLAMRASMAVPGLFSPVRVKDRLLVDGGLVRNLGVDVARRMGADIVIAVNVGSPLLDEREIQSALSVTDQMVRILTTQNVERSLAELRPQDILIDPELADVGLTDFKRSEQIVEGGRRASLAIRDRLQALALSEADYAAHEAWRQRGPALEADTLPLERLDITGTRRSRADALRQEIPVREGEPVSLAQLQEAKAQLYGRGDFDRVDLQVRDVNGRRQAELQVSEAAWARSRLRLGFEVASDFNAESRYTLSGLHTLTWLNAWGAELRTLVKIGWDQALGFTLNQPLGAGSAWYVEPSVRYAGYKVQAVLEDVKFSASEYSLALGRRLGRWGDLQLATTRFRGENRVTFRLKDSKFLSQWSAFRERQQQDTQELRWRVDTLDAPAFPEEGYLIHASTALAWADDQPSSSRQTVLKAKVLKAFRLGGWAGHVYWDAMQGTVNHPVNANEGLGRFLRLSGSSAPAGSHVLSYSFARLALARRLGQMPVGLGGAVRAGFSLEVGHEEPTPGANELIDTGSITRPRTRWANSAFVAIDTRFGPVYLGFGKTHKGDSSAYFFVGPVW